MHYQISAISPAAHIYQVKCHIDAPSPDGQLFSLPAWIPGSYMVRDFAKNIIQIRATCDGHAIPLTKLDKSTWQAAPCDGSLELEYEVYAWDLSVRTAHLDQTHAYFNGSSVFMRMHGDEEAPCTLELLPPVGDVNGDWRVATTLTRDGAEEYGFGRYRADNYEELIDHPVEMADFTLASFEAGGTRHEIALTGKHRADMPRICADLAKICQTHIDFFGELPPMEKYLFQIMVVGDGYGGLEHRASTSLLVSRESLPRHGETGLKDSYQAFLGLCSHEYFHTWNIKRIKPDVFVPYALQSECYTRQLWAFEGITSYYDDLGLVRSGCIKQNDYLQLLAQMITRVWRAQGRFKQSVAESSFDAWTKFYRQDENAPNAIVSYYSKGCLIALALDLTIRTRTQDRKSLDDLMQVLWQAYGKPSKGVPEGRIVTLATEIAGDDLGDFFQRYLYGTEDIPLDELLRYMGIEFILRPAKSTTDIGGTVSEKSSTELAARADLGIKTTAQENTLRIANVFENGAAIKAGLAAGDVLIAIDGLKITPTSLDKLLAQYQANESVEMHVFRRDELMLFRLNLQAAPLDTVELRILPGADTKTVERRKRWLTLK